MVNTLAQRAGLTVASGQAQRFGSRHHTYLSERFDQTATNERVHFTSAMTLLGYQDGTDYQDGVSYFELAAFLMRQGAHVEADLTELWRRIVFNICVANTDDHLRNHGFLLTAQGWRLSPAYDLNPVPYGRGLTLNISETENALDLQLALEVAPFFRLALPQAELIMAEVVAAIRSWRAVAVRYQISREEQELMANAFRIAES